MSSQSLFFSEDEKQMNKETKFLLPIFSPRHFFSFHLLRAGHGRDKKGGGVRGEKLLSYFQLLSPRTHTYMYYIQHAEATFFGRGESIGEDEEEREKRELFV